MPRSHPICAQLLPGKNVVLDAAQGSRHPCCPSGRHGGQAHASRAGSEARQPCFWRRTASAASQGSSRHRMEGRERRGLSTVLLNAQVKRPPPRGVPGKPPSPHQHDPAQTGGHPTSFPHESQGTYSFQVFPPNRGLPLAPLDCKAPWRADTRQRGP